MYNRYSCSSLKFKRDVPNIISGYLQRNVLKNILQKFIHTKKCDFSLLSFGIEMWLLFMQAKEFLAFWDTVMLPLKKKINCDTVYINNYSKNLIFALAHRQIKNEDLQLHLISLMILPTLPGFPHNWKNPSYLAKYYIS